MRHFDKKYPIPNNVNNVVKFVYNLDISHYDLVRLSDSAIIGSYTRSIVCTWELEIFRPDVVFN